jgi:hypothetical protein
MSLVVTLTPAFTRITYVNREATTGKTPRQSRSHDR